MRYANAVKLHKGDQVTTKYTNRVVTVLSVENDKEHREIYLYCDDGETYIHRAVR